MGKLIDKSEFWLIKDNPITKTGVFPYLGAQIGQQGLEPEKIYYVLRPAEELFKPETVESFNGIPITIEHAMLGSEDKGLTKPEDKGIDGVTLESAHAQGDKLLNNIRLFSEQIKDAVNSGKKELSAGYYCDFVPESGDYHGQHYDFVQRNIFGNHIALVDKGRSGSEIRVMDSAIKSRMVFDSMDLGTFTQDWQESEHPRDNNGQFAEKGGGKSESKKSSETNNKNTSYFDNVYDYKKELGKLEDLISDNNLANKYAHWRENHSNKKEKQYRSQLEKVNKIRIEKKYTPENEKFLTQHTLLGYEAEIELRKQFLKDLKTNGASGQDTAPEQEEAKMDKREVVREIMAIAAKPETEFKGGEEERIDTIAKLAEKIAYNPSETGANDKCAADKEEDKENVAEPVKVKPEAEKADEEKEKEEKIATAMDAIEKRILANMEAKNSLIAQLTPVIGAFDSAKMTVSEIAKYACDKLKLTCATDEALPTLKGFLAGKKQEVIVKPAAAMDSANTEDEAIKNYKEGK